MLKQWILSGRWLWILGCCFDVFYCLFVSLLVCLNILICPSIIYYVQFGVLGRHRTWQVVVGNVVVVFFLLFVCLY